MSWTEYDANTEWKSKSYIMLEGNLTEGFVAYGPYESFDVAADAHEFCEGWVMEMRPPQESEHDKYVPMGRKKLQTED